MKKLYAFIVAFLILLVFVFMQKPLRFQLQVVNSSAVTVDQVRLWGEGVVTDGFLFNLAPGQVSVLDLELSEAGDLRFEVQQGLTKADSLIIKDVRSLKSYRQLLTVHPGNRFILSSTVEAEK